MKLGKLMRIGVSSLSLIDEGFSREIELKKNECGVIELSLYPIPLLVPYTYF
jgi:hypothetical protein